MIDLAFLQNLQDRAESKNAQEALPILMRLGEIYATDPAVKDESKAILYWKKAMAFGALEPAFNCGNLFMRRYGALRQNAPQDFAAREVAFKEAVTAFKTPLDLFCQAEKLGMTDSFPSAVRRLLLEAAYGTGLMADTVYRDLSAERAEQPECYRRLDAFAAMALQERESHFKKHLPEDEKTARSLFKAYLIIEKKRADALALAKDSYTLTLRIGEVFGVGTPRWNPAWDLAEKALSKLNSERNPASSEEPDRPRGAQAQSNSDRPKVV